MKLIGPFLKIQNQIRVFHWQTLSYAQHKAFGKAYEQLDDLIDTFIEVYMGKNGRSHAKVAYNIELQNLNDEYMDVINYYIDFLTNDILIHLSEDDTDLLNIRDEMLAVLNRLKYLLSLG